MSHRWDRNLVESPLDPRLCGSLDVIDALSPEQDPHDAHPASVVEVLSSLRVPLSHRPEDHGHTLASTGSVEVCQVTHPWVPLHFLFIVVRVKLLSHPAPKHHAVESRVNKPSEVVAVPAGPQGDHLTKLNIPSVKVPLKVDAIGAMKDRFARLQHLIRSLFWAADAGYDNVWVFPHGLIEAFPRLAPKDGIAHLNEDVPLPTHAPSVLASGAQDEPRVKPLDSNRRSGFCPGVSSVHRVWLSPISFGRDLAHHLIIKIRERSTRSGGCHR